MPVIFRYKGYRFFFYSNEGDPLEPVHIHVRKGENTAKFWLEPYIALAGSYGMKPGELAELEKVIITHHELIERKWNEYFGG